MKKSMFLFYFSITLAIASSALYHFVQKSTPGNINFAVSLLVYRSGWNIGIAALLVNVVASLILVPVAIFVFKDRLNWVNIVGILVCLIGLVMLNWKR